MKNLNDPHAKLPLMKNGLPKTNDSHAYLNSISHFKESGVSQDKYEKSQMPLNYTRRRKFIRMMRERDQNEDKVIDYTKAGKYMTKVNRQVATIMFDNGYKYRSNSQKIQRQMEEQKKKSFRVEMDDKNPDYMRRLMKELKRYRTLSKAQEVARVKFLKDIQGKKKHKK